MFIPTDNIQLIPERVIRDLAQMCGVDDGEAISLVARFNAAQDFKGLDKLARVVLEEYDAFGSNKKTILIVAEKCLEAVTTAAGITALYFRFVAGEQEIKGNTHAEESMTLDASTVSMIGTGGMMILTYFFKSAKVCFDEQLGRNQENRKNFMARLIRLMKGEDSWKNDYANTRINRVDIPIVSQDWS